MVKFRTLTSVASVSVFVLAFQPSNGAGSPGPTTTSPPRPNPRLRVTAVKYVPDDRHGNYYGWVVTTEFRNGGKQLLNLSNTGIEKGVSLALKDGSTKELGLSGIASAFKTGTDLPPGAGLVMDLPFSWQGGTPTNEQLQANPPVKLIVPVDVTALRRGGSTLYKTVNYVKDPNFRVNLTCKK